MSDDVDVEENGDEEAPPKKSKKLLFIIGGAVLAVVLLGGGAAFFLMSSGGGEDGMVAEAPPSYYFDLEPITVNLNGGESQFLRVSISLELADEEAASKIEPRMARVVDAFQVYLRELRKSDLEGSAGIYRLKEELRRRVNLAIAPAEVNGILFREILVQ